MDATIVEETPGDHSGEPLKEMTWLQDPGWQRKDMCGENPILVTEMNVIQES